MKYLAILRGLNEPDNNTPSDVVYVKIIESDKHPQDIEGAIVQENEEDFDYGVEVSVMPLESLNDWTKATTIW